MQNHYDKWIAELLRFTELTNKCRKTENRHPNAELLAEPGSTGDYICKFMLIAWFAVRRFGLRLQLDRVFFYIMTRDLPKAYAINHRDSTGKLTRQGEKACRRIAREWWFRFPELIRYLSWYDLQADEESRFVHELGGLINTLGMRKNGCRADALQAARSVLAVCRRFAVIEYRPNENVFAKDLVEFAEFIDQFCRIERTIWYDGLERPERDGEHVSQSVLCAWFAIRRFNLDLHIMRTFHEILVHDLPEVDARDTPAFMHPNRTNQPTHIDKEEREEKASERIRRKWEVRFPSLVHFLKEYRAQDDEHAHFVYAFEKLLARLNVYLDGGRSNFRLGTTRKAVNKYKHPRVARHPFIKALYSALDRLHDKVSWMFPSKRQLMPSN